MASALQEPHRPVPYTTPPDPGCGETALLPGSHHPHLQPGTPPPGRSQDVVNMLRPQDLEKLDLSPPASSLLLRQPHLVCDYFL